MYMYVCMCIVAGRPAKQLLLPQIDLLQLANDQMSRRRVATSAG